MTGHAPAMRALTHARLRATAGMDPGRPHDLPPRAAAALALAHEVGAPVVPTLDAAIAAVRHDQDLAASVAAALAPARTVAIALLSLPAVAVPLLGRVLEVDLAAFYTTPLGIVVGTIAAALWFAGGLAIVLLVRSVARTDAPRRPTVRLLTIATVAWVLAGPVVALLAAVVVRLLWRPAPAAPAASLDVACDLLAAAVQAGLPAGAGLRLVAHHVPPLADELRRAALVLELGVQDSGDVAASRTAVAPLVDTLVEGLAAGAPLSPALSALAHDLRAERGARTRADAERLPARLTFPTALCLLPATVLAIGAPIVAVGLGTVAGT